MGPNRSWISKWIAKGGVVFLSGAVALGAAEFVLRHWLHAVPQLELDLYSRDTQGNLRLRPNITRRHVTRLWDVEIRINAEGWRDRAAAAPGQMTLLGLGDSMAFGWGVELEESFLFLLEQHLQHEQPVRLVKAAVPGTGPGDQLRLLQTIWAEYDPAAVLLCFFVGNDFVDVQMGGSAQFDVENGLLVRRAMGDEPVSWSSRARTSLIRSSHLLQLARAVQLNWSRNDSPSPERVGEPRHWDDWLREFAQIHLKNYPERTRQAVAETFEYLDELEAYCRQRAVPLVLIVIPRSYQVYPEERLELIEALEISEADLDIDRPQRLLSEWASRRRVAEVDLLPAFRLHQQQNPGANLYHYPDAHLNAAGHRLAAAAIAGDAAAIAAIRSASGSAPQPAGSAAPGGGPTPEQGTPLQ